VDDDSKGWNQFRRIKLDRKSFAKRMRRAETTTVRHANRFILKRLDNVRLVRREITQWLVMVGVVIAGLGVQLLWGQSEYTMSAPAAGGTYVEGALGPIDTLNPLYASSSAEMSAGRLLFSSLYSYDSTGSIHQDAASGMTRDALGKVYTVALQDGIKWHDGAALTAKDVVFTVNLMKNPATRSPLRVNWLDVAAREIDRRTVQFTLPASYAAFPYALTFPIMPEHLLASVNPSVLRESPFSAAPVGSGPFMFRLLQSADAVRSTKVVHLEANPRYYRGRPKLDRIELQAYENEPAIVKALKIGELSGATDVSITSVNGAIAHSYAVTPQPLDSGVYLLLNNANDILSNPTVRRALQIATDTAALRESLGKGLLPLDSPFLEGQLTGVDVPHSPAPDINRAKQLLDEAGWKLEGTVRKKAGRALTLRITTTKNNEYTTVLDQIAKQWQPLGITIEKRVVDTSNVASTFVQQTLQARDYDVLLYELSIGADPDVYAYWHSSQVGQTGYNFANYSNKSADANLASARSRLEPELRNAKYKLFAKQWIDDAPAIGLYQPVVEYVANKNASTVAAGSRLVGAADRYANVLDWTIHRASVYKTP